MELVYLYILDLYIVYCFNLNIKSLYKGQSNRHLCQLKRDIYSDILDKVYGKATNKIIYDNTDK